MKYDANKQDFQTIFDDSLHVSAELPVWSPDDQYISFESYTKQQVEKSIYENRVIFNSVKPKYGAINVYSFADNKVVIVAEKGRDITWDQ